MSKIIQPKDRFKLIPAAYLFLIKDNKILLQRRKNTGFEDGNYGLVSGHLDGDETVYQAMVREVKEEAGIDLKVNDLKVVHVMHRGGRGRDNERIDFFITTKGWKGEVKNTEPDKCNDLRWFEINNLPENAIDFIKQAIECIQKNIFYSEFGW